MIREIEKSPQENISLNSYHLHRDKFFPSQFADPNIRLLKVRPHGKEAVEQRWQTKVNYSVYSPIIQAWIEEGGNYGLTSPNGFYVSVDADTKEIQDVLENKLPRTFRWSTGKPGHFQYGYFIQDRPLGCIPLIDGAYVKGKGGYALGPGSIHPNGVIYGSAELRDIPIATVTKADLLGVLNGFITGKESGQNKHMSEIPKGSGQILKVLAAYDVNIRGFRQVGSWFRGPHPIHGSETGSNFAVNPESDTWHCFRHGTGGGAISLIAVLDGLIECKDVQEAE